MEKGTAAPGSAKQVRVAFFASAEHGHNTPMLALAHELRQVCPDVKLYWATDSKEKKAALTAGAEWVPLEYHFDKTLGSDLPAPGRQLHVAARHFEAVSAWLCEVRPQVVIYDYFCIVAPLACGKLGIPCVCFRSGQPAEQPKSCPADLIDLQKEQAQLLKERFNVAADWQAPFVEMLSTELNILQVPLTWLGAARERYEPCATIGPSIVPRPLSDEDEALLAELDAPGSSFRVLISMGTVQGQKAQPEIEDQQALFQIFADAARLLPEARVVLSISGTAGAVDAEKLRAPSNCLVREFIPQLAVLQRVDCFLSHCGANSMHEALWAGVPILGVPIFGDQPGNAQRIEDNGWGRQRRWQELTPEMVANDLRELALSPAIRTALCQAQALEQEAIASRTPVAEKILELARRATILQLG
eukprot:CAMPEP_0115118848 /NCGR_PEP_ID=MMETSP0227-20121206/44735_1 /TAXON_ID=89957 /ORGANISM="Polarella glacialis, Strain CCMP 1383" /LENGTH=416 /DNA_ID=CAMNT_0002520195 /DNA_START=84 /DNA_END=1334 /DNA_ORIENTATION=+